MDSSPPPPAPADSSGPTLPGDAGEASGVLGARYGRYECLATLAAGGMGSVDVARLHSTTGVRRLVAVKTIHPHLSADDKFVRLFRREAAVASRLHHPNVVPVLEMGHEGRALYLVMDYFPSLSLVALVRSALRAQVRLPCAVVASIVADAAAGLHAVHDLADEQGAALGLVHRDVTPSNILVGADGAVKLTDFGVVKATHGEIEVVTRASGELRGKLGYLSPEQALGEPLDRRSDLFSLGIVLFELLAGRRLFRPRGSDAALIRAVLDEPIPDVRDERPDCPANLAAVLSRALARDRSRRFQTAADLRAALEACVAGAAVAERERTVQSLLGDELAAQRRSIADAAARLDARAAETTARTRTPAIAAVSLPVPPPALERTSRRGALLGLLGAAALGALGATALARSPSRAPHPEASTLPAPRAAPPSVVARSDDGTLAAHAASVGVDADASAQSRADDASAPRTGGSRARGARTRPARRAPATRVPPRRPAHLEL